MPEYKVFYFNVKALGEPLRYLLSYGNIQFEDVRITREEWPALKPTFPMNALPCLQVDGKRVNSSLACCRFIARNVGLGGSDDWENLQIDTIADTVNDFRLKIAALSYEPEDDVKSKKVGTLNSEVIPFYLEKLEDIARDNNGYLANGKLSWADFYFAGIIEYLNYLAKTDLVADFGNLRRVIDNVTCQDGVQDWINNRPKTEI